MAKIGRNDDCSCGSGKKFKRCCENKSTGLSRGTMLMVVLISVILVAGVVAAVSNFTSDTSGHVGQSSGVWSEEHGHYH
ncbi:MAG: SEC-C metal-binding domain-containing protein [Acidobacteria bacterium]|nr:SEC-C metal-binding domain-containing protein [Acidobacteriota bacterium]